MVVVICGSGGGCIHGGYIVVYVWLCYRYYCMTVHVHMVVVVYNE